MTSIFSQVQWVVTFFLTSDADAFASETIGEWHHAQWRTKNYYSRQAIFRFISYPALQGIWHWKNNELPSILLFINVVRGRSVDWVIVTSHKPKLQRHVDRLVPDRFYGFPNRPTPQISQWPCPISRNTYSSKQKYADICFEWCIQWDVGQVHCRICECCRLVARDSCQVDYHPVIIRSDAAHYHSWAFTKV